MINEENMMNNLIRNLTLTTTLLSGAVLAGPLSVTVYNPGEKAIFPVSSSLVAGDKEAILIDAQFDVLDTRFAQPIRGNLE